MSGFVDVEDEGVLSNIFKDAFPDSWRNNPDFAQYLADLSSFGVDKLNREPERLAEERTQILEQTQDLAFHNYKTFIETAECSRDIFQDFQIIESHVEAMLQKVPSLVDTCNTFTKQAQDINSSRRMNNVTLQRNTQLLEILEMPQLMDTCVRNGYYEEALELSSHVKRLEKKHGNIPIIMKIVDDIKVCSQLMLNQLIQQLRSNVQLPACLKVIGYLRRMDVFSEAELRIKFLQARDAWFQSILAGIPTDDPYYHVTKTIEASRVHLFDIITQYRAVFSDEDPILSPIKDDSQSESALFHGWLIQKVSQFLAVLETDLQRGIGPRLDSLLGQCMYFGLSFSRVGADFRGLLAPVFQRAALASFRQAIHEADVRFDEEMQSFTLLGNQNALPSSAYSLAQGSGGLQPPIALLEIHPMAAYCNALLTAYNDLRLCAPLSLACDVARIMDESLTKAGQVVIAYHRAEETTFNEQERERFDQMCHIYAEDLVPYMNRCQQCMFPPTVIAQTLGITMADLTKLGNIGTLNTEGVLEPIRFLLPQKPVEQPTVTIETDSETSDIDQSEPKTQTSGTTNQLESVTQQSDNQLDLVLENTGTELDLPSEIAGTDSPETEQSQSESESGDSQIGIENTSSVNDTGQQAVDSSVIQTEFTSVETSSDSFTNIDL